MRRDLIVGLVFSLLFHAGFAYFGEMTKYHPKPKPKDDTPTIALMEMPKLEPDEPEVVENNEQQNTPVDIAPPMQTDVPQVVTPDSFVQQVQPPPPEGLKMNASLTIPENRNGGLGKGITVFDISQLDQAPIPKFQARPQYPFEMRRAGISGDVLVDFIVDVNGDVRNPFAAHSSQREFEAAAVQAVGKWKFRPGRKNGHSVNTHMQVPIVFTLNEEN